MSFYTGKQMLISREETNAPLFVSVDNGGGVAGLIVVVSIRDNSTTNSYLDFNDNTFKTSGWTQKTLTLADIGNGHYSSTIDISAITNLPTGEHLALEYSITGSLVGIMNSLFTFTGLPEIQQAVTKHLKQFIWIDTELVDAGDGSQATPFNNLTAAIDHAEEVGIKRLIVLSDIVIDRQLKNFILSGIGESKVDCNGQDLTKSVFAHCQLEGTYTGVISAEDCDLLSTFELNGHFHDCGLSGDLTCIDGSTVLMVGCYSTIAALGRPTISMNLTGTSNLSIRRNSGGLTIKDCNDPADKVTVGIAQGSLTFDSSNTDGAMVARGAGKFVNNTDGATVIDEMIKPIQINEIWKILGLDIDDPLTDTVERRYVQSSAIIQIRAGDPNTIITTTRS